jgi:hypothetical protein
MVGKAMNEFQASSRDRARGIVRFSIFPTIAAGFETYPELDVAEVLRVCERALTDTLAQEFTDQANSSRASPKLSGLSPIGAKP